MKYTEYNFDGLVGPSHHYAGLAFGNQASMNHARTVSHPKAAALQGLKKMRLVYDETGAQGWIPPLVRPAMSYLRAQGWTGTDAKIIEDVAKQDLALLSAAYSASSMWTANAATVSPSLDTKDGRIHITTANLASHAHRAIEGQDTCHLLQQIFHDEKRFCHHVPLPVADGYRDEGAANHMRLSLKHDRSGISIFVYGQDSLSPGMGVGPQRYPARQTKTASEAIARQHQLFPSRYFFWQQHPDMIDQGIFHNDVIALSNENILIYHRHAYLHGDTSLQQFKEAYGRLFHQEIVCRDIRDDELSIRDAVDCYFFNSQLLTLPQSGMLLLAPQECAQHPRASALIQSLISDSKIPITGVRYVDLCQSMQNGGGPACLRLRVVLSDEEAGAVHPGVLVNKDRLDHLETWVKKHYRDDLRVADLADPHFHQECVQALDELSCLLNLPSLYSF